MLAFGVVLALSACSDPYDPGQRALGGGAIGAGAGAAIGGLAGGWHGAAVGALAGGEATGLFAALLNWRWIAAGQCRGLPTGGAASQATLLGDLPWRKSTGCNCERCS